MKENDETEVVRLIPIPTRKQRKQYLQRERKRKEQIKTLAVVVLLSIGASVVTNLAILALLNYLAK